MVLEKVDVLESIPALVTSGGTVADVQIVLLEVQEALVDSCSGAVGEEGLA